VAAVFEDLVAQGLPVCDAEVEVLEEGRDAGEETDAFDAELVSLMKERADEQAASAVAGCAGTNDDGAHFCEVWAVDVERGTTDESIGLCFNDGEGVDVFADLRVGAMEEGAVVTEAFDELIDGRGVLQPGGTRPH